MKRRVSMTVSNGLNGSGNIVQGRYQSPILVQWRGSESRFRHIDVRVYRFD